MNQANEMIRRSRALVRTMGDPFKQEGYPHGLPSHAAPTRAGKKAECASIYLKRKTSKNSQTKWNFFIFSLKPPRRAGNITALLDLRF
jgi:hypothetical protein